MNLHGCGKFLLLCLALPSFCCFSSSASKSQDASARKTIDAQAGGLLELGDGLRLLIPPNSLAASTELSVERIGTGPGGEAEGFTPAAEAFRFSPHGTTFSLETPARLSMRVDAADVSARGLDARTLTLFYFDEEVGRYLSVASAFDPSEGRLTARIEHFSVYVAMARAAQSGNTAPVVAMQTSIPSPIRAGAPVLIRATVRDLSAGSAIAGARLYYRALPDGQTFTMPMSVVPTVLDTWGAIVPGDAIDPAQISSPRDLEYWVVATDNLGLATESTHVIADVARSYNPGTLAVAPTSLRIASGFSQSFAVTGRDSLGTVFPLPTALGEVAGEIGTELRGNLSFVGFTYTAGRVGMGSFTTSFRTHGTLGGTETSAPAAINVLPGALTELEILDEDGMPIKDTRRLAEGHLYAFDARGRDAFGNSVLVLPEWHTAAPGGSTPPTIARDGAVSTLGADGFSALVASLGTVTSTRWVHVEARRMIPLGGAVSSDSGSSPSIAYSGSRPYVVFVEYDSASNRSVVRVRHERNGVWHSDGGPLNQDGLVPGSDPRVATAPDGLPWVALVESDPTTSVPQLHVLRFNGTAWVRVGSPLNLSAGQVAQAPDLKFVGGSAVVAWQEYTSGASQVLVARWDGESWGILGPSLNENVALDASRPLIADLAGEPLVAFLQATSGNSVLVAKRWSASNWSDLSPEGVGLNASSGADAAMPVAAQGPGGTVYLAWLEASGDGRRVVIGHFDGLIWTLDATDVGVVGGTLDAVAIGHSGLAPYLAFSEVFAGESRVYLAALERNGVRLLLGGTPVATAATQPSLAFGPSYDPLVAWREQGGAQAAATVRAAQLSAPLAATPQPEEVVDAGVASNDAGVPTVTTPREFFALLPAQWPDPPPPADVATELPPEEGVDSANSTVRFQCQRTQHDVQVDFDAILGLSGAYADVKPGMLLQGEPLTRGQMIPVPLRRAPLHLTIDLPISTQARQVLEPNSATLQEAVGSLQRQADLELTPAQIPAQVSYSASAVSSFQHASLSAGVNLNFNFLLGSSGISTAFSNSSSKLNVTVMAKLYQPIDTISFADDEFPTESDFLASDVTTADLLEQWSAGTISRSNLPAFVKSITYGRILLFTMTTSEVRSADDLEALVRGSFVGFSGDASVRSHYAEIASRAQIEVLALGGSSADALSAIRSADYSLFFTDARPGTSVPLSYRMQYLRGARNVARTGNALSYVDERCAFSDQVPTSQIQQWHFAVGENSGGIRPVATGIDVQPGDTFSFSAAGSIWAGVLATGCNGPAGWVGWSPDSGSPIGSYAPFSLIARIGNSGWLGVGSGASFSNVSWTGTVELGTNDNVPGNGDNCNTPGFLVDVYRTRTSYTWQPR